MYNKYQYPIKNFVTIKREMLEDDKQMVQAEEK